MFSLNLDTNVWNEVGRVATKKNLFPSKVISKKQETKPDGKSVETQISEFNPDSV